MAPISALRSVSGAAAGAIDEERTSPTSAAARGQLQRRLGVLVVAVDDGRRRSRVPGGRPPEPLTGGRGIRHRLDQDHNSHEAELLLPDQLPSSSAQCDNEPLDTRCVPS